MTAYEMRISACSSDVCSSDLLVGGDDEIGVLAVVDRDLLRMHDLAANDILVDRQQRADEDAIAFLPLGEPCVAVERRIGHRLRIEAVLRADRKNTRLNSRHSCASRLPSPA